MCVNDVTLRCLCVCVQCACVEVEDEIENETIIDLNEQSPAHARDHLRLPLIVDHLPCLRQLRLTYGVRHCGLNFNWNIFQFTLKVSAA